MTMDEIVRALRCCERENCGDSSQCPLYSDSDCITHLSGPTADLIEKLTAENADLLKELEWQGMIIALAQRKQAEAEAERDAAQTPEKAAWAKKTIEMAFSDDTSEIERLRELYKADKDGRVLILPCKVGDMAYWVHNGVITGCHVYRIQVNRKWTFVFLKSTISHGGFRTDACLGKTVFLSRVEAEKALQEMEAAK